MVVIKNDRNPPSTDIWHTPYAMCICQTIKLYDLTDMSVHVCNNAVTLPCNYKHVPNGRYRDTCMVFTDVTQLTKALILIEIDRFRQASQTHHILGSTTIWFLKMGY